MWKDLNNIASDKLATKLQLKSIHKFGNINDLAHYLNTTEASELLQLLWRAAERKNRVNPIIDSESLIVCQK